MGSGGVWFQTLSRRCWVRMVDFSDLRQEALHGYLKMSTLEKRLCLPERHWYRLGKVVLSLLVADLKDAPCKSLIIRSKSTEKLPKSSKSRGVAKASVTARRVLPPFANQYAQPTCTQSLTFLQWSHWKLYSQLGRSTRAVGNIKKSHPVNQTLHSICKINKGIGEYKSPTLLKLYM